MCEIIPHMPETHTHANRQFTQYAKLEVCFLANEDANVHPSSCFYILRLVRLGHFPRTFHVLVQFKTPTA